MKIMLSISFILLILVACGPPPSDEEIQKIKDTQVLEAKNMEVKRVLDAKSRVDKLTEILHACDTNSGLKDITVIGCDRVVCRGRVAICNNGMKREFND